MHGAEQRNYCPTAAPKMMEAPKEMEFQRPCHVFRNGRLVVCRIVIRHDWNAEIMRRHNAQFGWKQKSMAATVNALGVLAVTGTQIVGLIRDYHDASSPEGLIVVLIIDR